MRATATKPTPRSCPLQVRESEVCTFVEVERVILTFAATGERDGTLFWRDVTAEMVKDFKRRPDDDGGEIGLINPQ